MVFRASEDGSLIAEIFGRSNGTYGYRFNAWVAWRDAGDCVRSHGWLEISSDVELITGRLEEAAAYADQEIAKRGMPIVGQLRDAV